MGGEDKPLLAWHGHPMIDRILASVPSEMPKIISANRNLELYRRRGRVITDESVHDFVVQGEGKVNPGPLVGLLAGMSILQTEWALVSPGDTPSLPDQWWQNMFAGVDANQQIGVAHDGHRQQHLHLLIHRDLISNLSSYIKAGRHEVFRWLDPLKPKQILFQDTDGFRNMNHPEDLA